jgi:3-phosphoshikimate 1-carboxyvinyltransferase
MPTAPITIQPIDRPFDVTFPDVERGIPPIPGSKSLTNRALLLAALAKGTSKLTGVLFSDDTRVMMKALKDLGFTLDIDEPNTTVTVHGQGGRIPAKKADLHLGNAGTAMRFLTAACCLGEPGSVYTLDGVPRMRERPIGELVEPLRELGANIEYLGEEGYPPLRIHAKGLRGGDIHIPNVISSQYVSALLQVGPYCGNGLALHFKESTVSWPYVEMTAKLMCTGFDADIPPYGGKAGHYIAVNPKAYKRTQYAVEPDASNASYFLAAAAILGCEVTITGIGFHSLQGDAMFGSQILTDLGAECSTNNESTTIKGAMTIRGNKHMPLNDMPDMAQTLGIVALFADGPITIANVGNLRVKETDRMAAMQTELTKLGAHVTVHGDDITINPPPGGKITPAAIDTYDDHRMAMAFAVIGLAQPGITINDPDCVNKTFPEFFKYLDYLRQPPDNAKG